MVSMDCEMAKLIIMRGNSGSGKSTVAKELQRKFGRNTMLISQDVIRREMLWVRDGKENKAVSLLTELLRYGKRNSEVTILEGILTAEYYVPLFEMAVEEFDSNIHAYYYDIPFHETLSRHNSKANSHDFGEKEMRDWWREKDFINIIPEKRLTEQMSFSEVVSKIYKDLVN